MMISPKDKFYKTPMMQSWVAHKILEITNNTEVGTKFRVSSYTNTFPYTYVEDHNNRHEACEISKIVETDGIYFRVSISDSDWIGFKGKYGAEEVEEVEPVASTVWVKIDDTKAKFFKFGSTCPHFSYVKGEE